jgi:hypothetical protein
MPQLPADFADLEKFSDWILATEQERYAKRLEVGMDAMQVFYDAGMEKMDAALDHLDKFDLYDLPDPERNLMYLLQSVIMVSFPIEVWKQPRVLDSGAAWVETVRQPAF